MVKVSIVTPTHGRERFHARILACVRAQTFDNWEWLVLDDSPRPSTMLSQIDDPRVTYIRHEGGRLTIGEKRNRLAGRACGDILIHFDDDDWYAPGYVATVVDHLERNRLDCLNLRAWYLYDHRSRFFGYWDLMDKVGFHFCCGGDGISFGNLEAHDQIGNENGWGFGYAYRRRVWEAVRFPAQDQGEDGVFFGSAMERFPTGYIRTGLGLALHEIHDGNTSTAFCQYRLPDFMIGMLFPGYVPA